MALNLQPPKDESPRSWWSILVAALITLLAGLALGVGSNEGRVGPVRGFAHVVHERLQYVHLMPGTPDTARAARRDTAAGVVRPATTPNAAPPAPARP